MKNKLHAEIFKGILTIFSILLFIYLEQTRYEINANQFLLSDSNLINEKKILNSRFSNQDACELYPKTLGELCQTICEDLCLEE
jgi:hypothetical protein